MNNEKCAEGKKNSRPTREEKESVLFELNKVNLKET